MAKPSAFMIQLQRHKDAISLNIAKDDLQNSKDMALIALSDAFGFGAERLKRFSDSFDKTCQYYLHTLNVESNNGKGDREGTATVKAIEDKLKEICGGYYCPRSERFKW